MATVELTKENFQDTVREDNMVIVDFWASWCGPCKSFGPIFEQVSEQHPDIVFAKANTEQQQEMAAHFQIRSIPYLMVFRERIVVFAQAGMLPESTLQDLIGRIKGLDMDDVRAQIAEQAGKEKA